MEQVGRSVLSNTAHDVALLGCYEQIRIKGERDRETFFVVVMKGSDGKVQVVIGASRRRATLVEAGPEFPLEQKRRLDLLAAIVAPALVADLERKA